MRDELALRFVEAIPHLGGRLVARCRSVLRPPGEVVGE